MKEVEIESKWDYETGRWNNKKREFTDIKHKESVKTIKMRIEAVGNKLVLRFIGGPTGFESYYIEDLLENKLRSDDFCICGGTINSWPACRVKWSEVEAFMKTV